MLHIGIVSIMRDMFEALNFGVLGRAIENQIIDVSFFNPRDFADPPHYSVDDRPFGGGPGMVMCYEPMHKAIQNAKKRLGPTCKTIYLSPQGRTIRQRDLSNLVQTNTPFVFVAGRYEGVDERILMQDIDEEWSVGDFVVSGGEFAAMLFIDAIARLLPGCLGHPDSSSKDSFSDSLLDHPHYTRPAQIEGLSVPDVLLSGDHQAISNWRKQQSLGQTWLKRPDLLNESRLSEADKKLLMDFKQAYGRTEHKS